MKSYFYKSIKFKIFLAFALCILIMFAIGGAGIASLSHSNSSLNDVYESNVIPMQDLAVVMDDQYDVRIRIRNLAVEKDPAKASALADRIKSDEQDSAQHWKHYYPANATSPQEKTVADRIDGLLTQTQDEVSGIIAHPETFESVASGKMRDNFDQLTTSLRDDVRINTEEARDENHETQDAYNRTLWMLGILLVCGVALGSAILYVLIRAISTPLGKALLVANEIANGQLENQIQITETDEFGELLNSLQRMDMALTKTVREIKGATESIATASSEIAQGNQDLSQRTEMQASSLEETAASMEELTNAVRQNTDNARQAAQLAISATETAVKGGSVVDEVIATMEGISSSSRSIVDIISVIEGIAFQTNILALNAAVEAARAGEQGRGFAVVAGEVRTLAQRAATAAKEIKGLIETSASKVSVGSELVGRAGETMTEIVSAVKRVTDVMNEISAASAEQSSGIEQVNQAITQMDQITQQNAALVEQAAAAAASMEEQGQQLTDTVSVFHLRSTSPGGHDRVSRASRTAPKGPELKRPVLKRPETRRAEPPRRAAGSGAHAVANGAASPASNPSASATTPDDWTAF